MEEIQYINEHLLYKNLGHFAIILGFVMSLLAAAGYFFATQNRKKESYISWRRIGRVAFSIHGLSIFTIIGLIFSAMVNKYFEYQYVQLHVSEDLPMRYIFSAFWEGQEGSFLLWMFWHAVLGFILMWKAKEWEAPVLSVLAMVQAFTFTMILGIYISGETKVGSNPLMLLRDVMDIPLFNNADYVSLLQGNGLNPLLQNYWMTIHPPTLFLGFASTVVPFCYAIAGLWTGRHKDWLKPALPWALFSAAILGTGILMGGAWAYEALSFGGYWAWDPVENASLVPWILLLAGIHAHLIARNTGYSYKSTYLFYIFTFILILYSTYLTRSGILGDSSVHSFTEMGLETQLVAFMVFFTGLGLILFFKRRKEIPDIKEEEKLFSREFWMFIGSLVLLFSAVIITVSTSLPVINKIIGAFKEGFDGYTINDPIAHYNKYQLWIGVFIGLMTGFAQFLRYRGINWEKNAAKFWKKISIISVAAILLTVATGFWIDLVAWQFWLLAFTAYFAIAGNIDYLFSAMKGNLKMAGSVFSHVGFGIMLIGIIASGLNKKHISSNPVMQRGLLPEEMLQNNVLLFKGMPMFMSGYRVTYERDTMIGNLREFIVKYEKMDGEGKAVEEFTVVPTATYDNKVVKVSAFNPSTKHYLQKDIFTHIASLSPRERDFSLAKEEEDKLDYRAYILGKNNPVIILDTLRNSSAKPVLPTKVYLVDYNKNPVHPDYEPQEGDFAFSLKIAFEKDDTTFYAEPVLVLRQQLLFTYPVQINDLSFKVRLNEGTLNMLFPMEENLGYKTYNFKQGDAIQLNGLNIKFTGFNNKPKHPDYDRQEGDIAVGAIFEVRGKGLSGTYKAEPVYLIRGTSPFNLKDEIHDLGLHFRFTGIDPNTETIEVLIAQRKNELENIPVEIAKKSFRSDYIVLETIVFPGINLFWLGACLMMVGLGVSIKRNKN
ncbi:MAG TPA: cytochrome c assembly protein [Bacteroidetes bacterium]|nr:cytochrome c assembly protein [Bacteroidota bacterium]